MIWDRAFIQVRDTNRRYHLFQVLKSQVCIFSVSYTHLLYSLIQRIRLTYGIENPVIIQSEVGVGTEIIVTIKKIKMEK